MVAIISNKCFKNCHFIKTCKAHNGHKTAKIPSVTSKGRGYNTQFLLYPRPVVMTEGIFAVLYVSLMGLTRFYKTTVKTTVFKHLYLQFFY